MGPYPWLAAERELVSQIGMWRLPMHAHAPADFALSIAVHVVEMRSRGRDLQLSLPIKAQFRTCRA